MITLQQRAEKCFLVVMSVILSFSEQDNSRMQKQRGDPPEVINFCCGSGSACGFQITFFHFLQRSGDFRRNFISISHTVTGQFLWCLVKWLTPTRERIHDIFGSSMADIQIRINPESNPGSHNGLGEFALSQCFCVLMFF